mmetsp:Transcript_43070/g.101029  ORF Transcript_43070/g.101029 Transcript_43070/m.101029 type:complete len:216 (-) Transcript_43070:417-1064(-)
MHQVNLTSILLLPLFLVLLRSKETQFGVITASASSCGGDGISESSPSDQDQHVKCARWAARGECVANPRYMHTQCPVSCETHRIRSGDGNANCQGGGAKSSVSSSSSSEFRESSGHRHKRPPDRPPPSLFDGFVSNSTIDLGENRDEDSVTFRILSSPLISLSASKSIPEFDMVPGLVSRDFVRNIRDIMTQHAPAMDKDPDTVDGMPSYECEPH